MAFTTLRILMFIAALIIIIVGATITLFGPDFTANKLVELLLPLNLHLDDVVGFTPATVDSELRFYSVFFVAYGAVVAMTAKHLKTHLYYVPYLLALFFLGGLARAGSLYSVGTPHQVFSYLLYIELGAPIVLYMIYLKAVSALK